MRPCSLPPIGYQRTDETLSLFAWHEVENFGDKLGPLLFHKLTGRPVAIEARGLRPTFSSGPRRTIYCFLGTMAQLLSGPHRFVLCGFGAAPAVGPEHHGCKPLQPGLDLQIRSLRGPLTAQLLEDAGYPIPPGTPFGDPGLLVPAFFAPSPYRIDDFCIVPHHSDFPELLDKYRGMNVISPEISSYDHIATFVREITRYRAIFSTSLHTTILAESFGIPTIPLLPKLPFKFADFYRAVGKEDPSLSALPSRHQMFELFEKAVAEWSPIKWDPAPWLESLPFEPPAGISDRLSFHYRSLAAGVPLKEVDPGAAQRASLRLYYEGLASVPERDIPAEHSQSAGQDDPRRIVFDAHDFEACSSRAGVPLCSAGSKSGLLEIQAPDNPAHLVTRFVQIGDASRFTVELQLGVISGPLQVEVQDSAYCALATRLLTSDDARTTRRIEVYPEQTADQCIRIALIPFRGAAEIVSAAVLL